MLDKGEKMQREVKFRLWDKPNKQMIVGKDINVLLKNINNNKDHVYQQFTGLLDKNGVEVFEGDVVKISQDTKNRSHLIEYRGVSFGIFINDGKTFAPLLYNHCYYTCEVIGNIYENPELLDEN